MTPANAAKGQATMHRILRELDTLFDLPGMDAETEGMLKAVSLSAVALTYRLRAAALGVQVVASAEEMKECVEKLRAAKVLPPLQ